MKKTFLLHGFNVMDKGADTVEKLRPYIKEEVISFPYGWHLLSILWHNKKVAKDLCAHTRNMTLLGDVYAVGHSNGCAIIVEAARRGALLDSILLINPALHVNTVFPDSLRRIVVVYTKHDAPTRAARFFNKIPFLRKLVPEAWGAMGAEGYKGKDPRVLNMNMSGVLKGHSDLFEDGVIEKVAYMPVRELYL